MSTSRCYRSGMTQQAGFAPEDWALWRAVSSMRGAVDRALEQRLQRDAGLSLADFEVLRGLAAAEGHRLRAGALADALDWEKSRISHQVRRMADRGLLERASCPTDGRGTWVVLADAGRDAFAKGACCYVEVLQRTLFDHLGPADRAALTNVAQRVQRAAGVRSERV